MKITIHNSNHLNDDVGASKVTETVPATKM